MEMMIVMVMMSDDPDGLFKCLCRAGDEELIYTEDSDRGGGRKWNTKKKKGGGGRNKDTNQQNAAAKTSEGAI